MDCRCNCFGIAASSRRPVKRYNLLVPDIFPKTAPAYEEQIDPSTQRKIKKLCEYLERNPHRGPKISRRLARRINKELAAQRWGYVQVAVAAYIGLLDRLGEAGSLLFAKEVVWQKVAKPVHFYSRLPCGSGGNGEAIQAEPRTPAGTLPSDFSVVGVLLNHPAARMQTLGAQLLGAFLRQQVSAEALAQSNTFLQPLCRSALDCASDASELEKLHLAALGAIRDYIRLCIRASASLGDADAIVGCLLKIIPDEGISSGDQAAGPVLEGASLVNDVAEGTDPAATGNESDVAKAAFQDLCLLAQAPAEGKKLVSSLLSQADASGAWDEPPRSRLPLHLLHQSCRDEHQSYLAFSLLAAHVGAPGLARKQQLAVTHSVRRLGASLPPTLATAALVLSIKEFASHVAALDAATPNEDNSELRKGLLGCITELSANLEDAQHLLAAVAGVAAKLVEPSPASAAVLSCLQAALSSLEKGSVAAIPQPVLRQLMGIMVSWPQPFQVQAHALLLQMLARGSRALPEVQVHALLSAIWHEVTEAVADPPLSAAVERTVGGIVSAAVPGALAGLASFASSLEAAAEGRGDLPAPQKLRLLLLGEHVWAGLGERAGASWDAADKRLLLASAALGLRSGVEAPSTAADSATVNAAHKLSLAVASAERRAAVERVTSSLPAAGTATFNVLPVAALLPQEAKQQTRSSEPRARRLRDAVKSHGRAARPTHNQEDLRTVAGMLKAAEEERSRMRSSHREVLGAVAAAEVVEGLFAKLALSTAVNAGQLGNGWAQG